MKRYIFLTLLLILAFTVELRAENAVRFSDATVEPGGRFSVEMLIENDVLLGGATVPFRWSSPDITFDSAVVRPERWAENIRVIYQQTNLAERYSALTFIRSLVQGETGWIPEGDGSIATLYFSVGASAEHQYAFVDSVYQVRDGQPIRWVNWSTYGGSLIAPAVYPGRISIGAPDAVAMTVTPSSVTLTSNSGALAPVTSTLRVDSESDLYLDWIASWSSDWLSLAPSVGHTPSIPSVSADAFTLLPGVYLDTLILESESAENSPLLIPITFVVDTAITVMMNVLPAVLVITGKAGALLPATTALQIQSSTPIQFDWKVGLLPGSWLKTSPTFGRSPGSPTVIADARHLSPGIYHDTLSIEAPLANNSPVFVPVEFTVEAGDGTGATRSRATLFQSRPSPYVASSTPETNIPFSLQSPSHVEITIFDILGHRVKTLTSEQYGEGEGSVIWDGRNSRGEAAASGHYICRMATSSGESSRVIVLIR